MPIAVTGKFLKPPVNIDLTVNCGQSEDFPGFPKYAFSEALGFIPVARPDSVSKVAQELT